MKALVLEMLEDRYNPMEWTHAFTGGFSEGAAKNGGGGVFVRHTDGRLTPRAFPTGKRGSSSAPCSEDLHQNSQPASHQRKWYSSLTASRCWRDDFRAHEVNNSLKTPRES